MKMKKVVLLSIVALFLCIPIAGAEIGFELNIKGGIPLPQPGIVVKEAPTFLVPGALGFKVAVGVPYDMFLISGKYYAFHGDAWYLSTSYKGPWKAIKYKNLPPRLRKHRIEKIRAARDEEFEKHKAKKDHGDGHGKGKGKHKGKN